MGKRKISGVVASHILILISGAALGIVALLLVHLLPTEPMKKHVYWSMGMLEKEFTDETLIDGFDATLTGSFTDCLMLEHAVYTSEKHTLFEQVLHMYRGESHSPEGWWPGYSLKDYLENVPQQWEVEYSRYWHGYLVILKPLLLFFSLNIIRLMNASLQLIIAGLVLIGFCEKKAYLPARGFLISLPFLFFVSTYASLSLSICFYIMTAALLIELKSDEYLNRKGLYGKFFLVLGMITAYFDFLTYPLITLLYPLCVYLYLHEKSFGENIVGMVKYSMEWFVGYMGLWAAKWVLVDLFTGSAVIENALSTILTRTQSAAGGSRANGLISVLSKNLAVYGNWCYVLLIAAWLLILLLRLKRGQEKNENSAGGKMAYFVLALYPIGWYFVTQNHAEEHWQFTCRILAAGVFAGVTGFERLLCKQWKE